MNLQNSAHITIDPMLWEGHNKQLASVVTAEMYGRNFDGFYMYLSETLWDCIDCEQGLGGLDRFDLLDWSSKRWDILNTSIWS